MSAQLEIRREGRAVQTFDVPPGVVRIGRAKDDELILDDRGVSRFHAELRHESGAYVLADLDSQNGTWIKGNRRRAEERLAALQRGVKP